MRTSLVSNLFHYKILTTKLAVIAFGLCQEICGQSPVSDDFSSATLDTVLWTLEDPQGGANVTMTGTQANIFIPGGIVHDPWINGNTATRLVQSVGDADFEIELKVESSLITNQLFGLMIMETDSRYLRFDVYDNGSTNFFAAYLDGGTSSIHINSPVVITSPIWLKVGRSGDTWTYSYSSDGQNWIVLGSFDQLMTVSEVGPFVGNFGTAPSHTAVLDYFFDTSSPIIPEDGGAADETPPDISNIDLNILSNEVTVTWTTNELATSQVKYGLSANYTDSITSSSLLIDHSMTIPGLTQNTTYHFQLAGTDGSGNKGVTSDSVFITDVDTTGPSIWVWHGHQQIVGHLGPAQYDFNVLGNVSDSIGVAHMEYYLNGVGPDTLSVGDRPDGFGDGNRLAATGDFNADIDIDNLNPGTNTVILIAVDSADNISRDTVYVDLLTGNSSLPYIIQWDSIGSPQEVGQYVDGLWAKEPDGIRTVRTGYDRLFLIGDSTWTDYEITLPITIHSRDIQTGPFSGDPGVGLMMRFKGHIVGGFRNWPDTQPKIGYQPFGAIGWLRWKSTGPVREFYRGDADITVNHGTYPAMFDSTYWVKMSCETLPDSAEFGITRYNWKIWKEGETEPQNWDWQVNQVSEHALREGAFALVAHHMDITFGDITVINLIDTIPPVINGLSVNASPDSATINWTTDELATSKLLYGLSTSYTDSISNLTALTNHEVILGGLTPASQYHFQIISIDTSGNSFTSEDFTFFTDDNVPPVISNVKDSTTSTTSVLSWSTDELSTGQVRYGLSLSYSDSLSIDSLSVNFAVELSDLDPATVYHYQIEARDSSGNITSTNDMSFFTLDTVSPEILNIEVSTSHDEAVHQWETNELTTAKLRFGLTSNYTDSISIDSLSATHQLTLTDLDPATVYHYQIVVYDSSGNNSTTTDLLFITFDNIPPEITISEVSPSNNQAFIEWETDELTTSKIRYGLSALYSDSVQSSTLTDVHNAILVDLEAATFYHYQIVATDSIGNVTETSDMIFFTDDNIPPIISDIDVLAGVNTATVTWMTSELTSSMIRYGQTSFYTDSVENFTQKTLHEITLSELDPAATYHFQVVAIDSTGNVGSSPDQHFVTIDNIPPTIGDLMIDPEASEVSISWATNELTSTTFLYGPTENYGDTILSESPDTLHNVIVDGLTSATLFYFKIIATDTNANSSSVDSLFSTLDNVSPELSNIQSVPTSDGVTINWTTNEVSTSLVFYGTTEAYSDTIINNQLTLDHELHIENLDGAMTYHFQIHVMDSAGNQSSSGDLTFLTQDDVPPEISEIDIINTGNPISIFITWVTDELSISTVLSGLSSQYSDTLKIEIPKTEHTIELTDLVGDSQYHYQIDATDLAGNTSSTTDLIFTTPDNISPAIENVQTTADAHEARILWTTDEMALAKIIYGKVPNYTDTLLNGQFSLEFDMILKPLDPETKYQYQIIVEDSVGNVNMSAEMSFMTIDNIPPTIQDVQALPVNNEVTIQWLTDEKTTAIFYYGLTTPHSDTIEIGTLSDSHAVQISDLLNNAEYQFRIEVFDASGNPSATESLSFKSADIVGPVIDNVKVIATDSNAVIAWVTDEPSRTWLLYGLTTSYSDSIGNDEMVTDHQVTLDPLAPETSYHFQISGQDNSGNVTITTDHQFSTLSGTEILGLGSRAPLVITAPYPNPFDDVTQFTLTAIGREVVLISLFDLSGRFIRLIYEGNPVPGENHTFKIESTELADGLYLIKIETHNFTEDLRVLLRK